jgi:hypothetical protein
LIILVSDHAGDAIHAQEQHASDTILICVAFRLTAGATISGEHTWLETPVPIPNTAVKQPGPMIVPKGAKVGYRRIHFHNPRAVPVRGFFW